MARSVLYGALLVGIGLAAGMFVGSRRESPLAAAERGGGAALARNSAAPGAESGRAAAAGLERQLERLAQTLAAEVNERHRLEERLDGLAEELSMLRASADSGGAPGAENASLPPSGAIASSPAASSAAVAPVAPEDGASATERALFAAGIDPLTAVDIKRRRDELTLSELYLRDQAGREGWVNSPRFAEEMAEIERQRTSIRDEIGDDAYDRYLAALGEPNRVTVDEVMLDSAAAQAGLQSGDVVLRYGDTRIFAPEELVAETRAGTAGETVRVEVMRNGQRLEIAVPRGPLGLHIASSRGNPDES